MTDTNELASRAEAFLFMEGGTLSMRKLAALLKVDRPALEKGLEALALRLQGRGITLIRTENEATLALSNETSRTVEEAYKEELGREIGDAGLEVLAIILYRGPITRAQIDYIRGVNTSSTIRTLMSRGLLERIGNPLDGREYLYRPTVELLAQLGVESEIALPDHATIQAELKAFENTGGVEREEEAKPTDELS